MEATCGGSVLPRSCLPVLEALLASPAMLLSVCGRLMWVPRPTASRQGEALVKSCFMLAVPQGWAGQAGVLLLPFYLRLAFLATLGCRRQPVPLLGWLRVPGAAVWGRSITELRLWQGMRLHGLVQLCFCRAFGPFLAWSYLLPVLPCSAGYAHPAAACLPAAPVGTCAWLLCASACPQPLAPMLPGEGPALARGARMGHCDDEHGAAWGVWELGVALSCSVPAAAPCPPASSMWLLEDGFWERASHGVTTHHATALGTSASARQGWAFPPARPCLAAPRGAPDLPCSGATAHAPRGLGLAQPGPCQQPEQ